MKTFLFPGDVFQFVGEAILAVQGWGKSQQETVFLPKILSLMVSFGFDELIRHLLLLLPPSNQSGDICDRGANWRDKHAKSYTYFFRVRHTVFRRAERLFEIITVHIYTKISL